jgi:hypothetical protein
MFGGLHHRDELKRTEQSGWSTENRTATSARCSLHKVPLRSCTGVYTGIKNLTESLLTRPTSLDMSLAPLPPRPPAASGLLRLSLLRRLLRRILARLLLLLHLLLLLCVALLYLLGLLLVALFDLLPLCFTGILLR